MERKQKELIQKDLTKKMVFLAGPRQVGKTFLAKEISKSYSSPLYLNYDNLEDREIINAQSWRLSTDLLILDELHKMPEWKNYLKGIFDTRADHLHILVSGSARLDIFSKVGDSLAGRYFLHRLLPLSPAELTQLKKPIRFDDLLSKSGFPEPYLADNIIEAERWRMQYINSILSVDVFDFDHIRNIKAIRTLFELLRKKVGSPISYQSIAEDIAISPNTVKKYIEILEALYVIFRVAPFSKNIARSILKEPKIYFFDTGLVKGDEGTKLENLVAVCLLKHVYGKVDYQAEEYVLNYIRTKDGQEIDFALVKDDSIQQIIEVKNSKPEISKFLFQFQQQHGLPGFQVVKDLRLERVVNNIQVIQAVNYLKELYL